MKKIIFLVLFLLNCRDEAALLQKYANAIQFYSEKKLEDSLRTFLEIEKDADNFLDTKLYTREGVKK